MHTVYRLPTLEIRKDITLKNIIVRDEVYHKEIHEQHTLSTVENMLLLTTQNLPNARSLLSKRTLITVGITAGLYCLNAVCLNSARA